MEFSQSIKQSVYKILSKEWDRIYNSDSEEGLQLLNEILDLESLPTTDGRYENALGDARQHLVNNFDWETEYVFLTRFNIYEDNDVFKRFAEVLLDPKYYQDKAYHARVSEEVDNELRKDELRLVIEDYNDLGFAIQKVVENKDEEGLPVGIKKNDVPFYVLKKIEFDSIKDDVFFTLYPNLGWNDYSVVSIFQLRYYDINHFEYGKDIGPVKIVHKDELITYDQLSSKFYQLSETFCSLGQEEDYYFNIQQLFGDNNLASLLFALKDAAYFTDIHDKYERTYNFRKSLIRWDNAERILREMRHKLQGKNLGSLYKFTYRFKPAFTKEPIDIELNFDDKEPLPNRIIAIIGKNGAGKTQLMNSLPTALAESNIDLFKDKSFPLFSKIIAVSYSVFDSFKIPKKNATFNYVYCGLRDEEGNIRENKSLLISFHSHWKRILEIHRGEKWRSILKNFIDDDLVDSFVVQQDGSGNINYEEGLTVSVEKFTEIRKMLSSGQAIILYIITSIIANIRYDALLIYDEPETHLHPNAIVQLMNTIFELLNEFESYCLIATHSPLVIRELHSRNVYVLDREGNIPAVRRIGLESFGENLGTLTTEVFGDREMPKQYKKIISELVKKDMSYEELVKLLEFDEYPLSLNTTIFIRNLLKEKNEK